MSKELKAAKITTTIKQQSGRVVNSSPEVVDREVEITVSKPYGAKGLQYVNAKVEFNRQPFKLVWNSRDGEWESTKDGNYVLGPVEKALGI